MDPVEEDVLQVLTLEKRAKLEVIKHGVYRERHAPIDAVVLTGITS